MWMLGKRFQTESNVWIAALEWYTTAGEGADCTTAEDKGVFYICWQTGELEYMK